MERSYDADGSTALFGPNRSAEDSSCAWKYYVTCGVFVGVVCMYIFILLTHVIFLVVHEITGSWVKFRKQGEIVKGKVVKRYDEMDSFVSSYTNITVECNINGFTSWREFKYPWRYGRYHVVGESVECIHIPGQSPTSWRRTQDVGNVRSLCTVFWLLMVVVLACLLVLAFPLVLYYLFDCSWTSLSLASGLSPVVLVSGILVPRLSSWMSSWQHKVQYARTAAGDVAGGESDRNDYVEKQTLVEDEHDSILNIEFAYEWKPRITSL